MRYYANALSIHPWSSTNSRPSTRPRHPQFGDTMRNLLPVGIVEPWASARPWCICAMSRGVSSPVLPCPSTLASSSGDVAASMMLAHGRSVSSCRRVQIGSVGDGGLMTRNRLSKRVFGPDPAVLRATVWRCVAASDGAMSAPRGAGPADPLAPEVVADLAQRQSIHTIGMPGTLWGTWKEGRFCYFRLRGAVACPARASTAWACALHHRSLDRTAALLACWSPSARSSYR